MRNTDIKKGYFISFEGLDGSGKSTQIKKLNDYLRKAGYNVVISREPGGTAIGEKIREIILSPENGKMTSITEAMLYAASRAQHVDEVIKPALSEGKIVICDRFVDSSIAYQGYGRGIRTTVETINEYATAGCMPDITFFLNADHETGTERMKNRSMDRIELEQADFHNEVYKGYRDLEKNHPDRIKGVDATKGIEEIFSEIRAYIDALLEKGRGRNEF